MRCFIFISLILFISCETGKRNKNIENSQINMSNRILITSGNEAYPDTLKFEKNGILNYIHTGIGVHFSGKYEYSEDKVVISIFDFENQFDQNARKIITYQFELKIDKTKRFVSKINIENTIFDKVKVNTFLTTLTDDIDE